MATKRALESGDLPFQWIHREDFAVPVNLPRDQILFVSNTEAVWRKECSLPGDAESPLFPRGGKEVTRKVALWYTAKPTNDMRQETAGKRSYV